jgi:16S rRNA (adenine1518-N6/adenine1519-N6)-dimethyltransferase
MDEEKYFEGVSEYKLLAKHEVGQNFLVDKDACRKIVALACLNEEDKALEIGSGAGSLSFYIASSLAESDLIDIDEALVTKLQHDFEGNSRVHPKMGNIMRYDLEPYTKIIGNLPYYITSGIIEQILLKAYRCQKAVLMVQKEVVARLSAPVGSEDYGPLIILLNYRATLKKEFNVSRNSFSPAPHVDSSVFTLSFKSGSDPLLATHLYELTSYLFLHRRKTILNNLGAYMKDNQKALSLLKKLSLDEKKRPENLTLQDYLALVSQLY